MNKRKSDPKIEPRLVDTAGLCAYLSAGRHSAVEFARSIGAEKRFGRSCRYDLKVIDQAVDKMNE